jgi:hypothetical protein
LDPVEGLIGPAIGVNGHAAIGFDHDQSGGERKVGREPAFVVDTAVGDDESHGV